MSQNHGATDKPASTQLFVQTVVRACTANPSS